MMVVLGLIVNNRLSLEMISLEKISEGRFGNSPLATNGWVFDRNGPSWKE